MNLFNGFLADRRQMFATLYDLVELRNKLENEIDYNSKEPDETVKEQTMQSIRAIETAFHVIKETYKIDDDDLDWYIDEMTLKYVD